MSRETGIDWTDGLRARFWANVNKNGPIAPNMATPCWIWTAGLFSNGYGQFRAGTRKVRVHRAAYELLIGPIPEDLILCHRCDVCACCRPDHVFLGDHAANAADRDGKGRASKRPPPRLSGEANPAALLSEIEAITIRVLLSTGVKRETLAQQYRVSPSTIRAIEENRIWRNRGPEDLD